MQRSLEFLSLSVDDDVEVIISDNASRPELSVAAVCSMSHLKNLRYFQPERSLSMTDNWSYALQHAQGEYICYLTDKMFLLPSAIRQLRATIEAEQTEIVSWKDAKYRSYRSGDYFGAGLKFAVDHEFPTGLGQPFSPLEALRSKTASRKSHFDEDVAEYALGKICFGAYSRSLIDRVVKKCGALFFPFAPDYTSMILACSEAKSGWLCDFDGVVHVHTDLSNGTRFTNSANYATEFLRSEGFADGYLPFALFPSLNSSIHNALYHQYAYLRHEFELDYELDQQRWIERVATDLGVTPAELANREAGSVPATVEHVLANGLKSQSKGRMARWQKRYIDLRRRLLSTGSLFTLFGRLPGPLRRLVIAVRPIFRGYRLEELRSIDDLLQSRRAPASGLKRRRPAE